MTIREYLMEMGVPTRPKTAFEKAPCYMCRHFDPWVNVEFVGYESYCEFRPCEHRRNYCLTFDKLCKKYTEAGKTFWSAERWRIKNKSDYAYMNANLFKNHSLATTVIKNE